MTPRARRILKFVSWSFLVLFVLLIGFVIGKSNPTVELSPGAALVGNRVICPECPKVSEPKPCPSATVAKQRPCSMPLPTVQKPVPTESAKQPVVESQLVCCGQDVLTPQQYKYHYDILVLRK